MSPNQQPKLFSALQFVTPAILATGLGVFGWQLTNLQGAVDRSRDEVHALRARLDAARDERVALEERAAELGRRAEILERSLADARAGLAASGQDAGTRIGRVEEREAVLTAGFGGLKDEVSAAARRMDEQTALVSALRRRLDSVAPSDYANLLGPTVKISSKSDVGSGTVIYSDRDRSGKYVSYVLTAHHIVEQNYDPQTPIPLEVISFVEGAQTREERGVVISVNPTLDLALIELKTERPYESVAKLITPGRIPEVKLYSRVSAIGCPLGYAPTPTSGELTSKSKLLDGQAYWMINAPTIFGNSGGGIYLSETGEMIGVLSRISAYKNLIDVAVPHMGIITAMNEVYAWLDREQYQFVVDKRFTAEDCRKARLAAAKKPGPISSEVLGAMPVGKTAPASTGKE